MKTTRESREQLNVSIIENKEVGLLPEKVLATFATTLFL